MNRLSLHMWAWGISQLELSQKAGIDLSLINRAAKRGHASERTRKRISEALSTPEEALFPPGEEDVPMDEYRKVICKALKIKEYSGPRA